MKGTEKVSLKAKLFETKEAVVLKVAIIKLSERKKSAPPKFEKVSNRFFTKLAKIVYKLLTN